METSQLVEKYGFAAIVVVPDRGTSGPHFTYTIGLWSLLGYELIAFGINPKTAAELFAVIYEEIKAEKVSLKLGVDDNTWGNLPCRFYRCDDYEALHDRHTCQADAYWGELVPAVQVVFPDEGGRFFDNPEYNWRLMRKPQPFLFKEGQERAANRL